MIKKIIFSLVAIVFVLTNMFTGLTNIAVAEDSPDDFEELLKIRDSIESIDDDQIKEELLSIYEAYIEENPLDVDSTKLDYDLAAVNKVKETGDLALTIPVVSDNYHEISNVSVMYNKENNIISLTEMQVYGNEHGNFAIKILLNGELVKEQHGDETFVKYRDRISTAGVNWDTFKDCVGLPTYVGGAVVTVCQYACAVFVPCAICLAGALGITIGVGTTCLTEAWE